MRASVEYVITCHTHATFLKEIDNILHVTIPAFGEDMNDAPDARDGILELREGKITYTQSTTGKRGEY